MIYEKDLERIWPRDEEGREAMIALHATDSESFALCTATTK
jgi:hypothetical protein